MIRKIGVAVLLALPAFGAVTGTVINRTTGQPQAGATVALNRLDENGMEFIAQAKADAQGKFVINKDPSGPPHLIRTAYDGVTYNHMLPSGSPSTDLTIEVFNASKQPGAARISKHMLVFQPSGGQVAVNETFLLSNDGKTAWNDADSGTVHFYLPSAAGGKAKAEGTAPGGMPIAASVVKTAKADVFGVDFPVKPGETRIDVTYAVPYKEGAPYEGKIASKDENTYLIAPNGVTLAGDGLSDMGAEPRTQAHIFGLTADNYRIQLTGTPLAAADNGSAEGTDSQDSSPQIEQIMPRLYTMTIPILALALGILALGFALLYRAQPAGSNKEGNERGRG